MRNTIKQHQHFLMAETDETARSSFFLIRMRAARLPDDPQYGLVVTKRMFRHAVDRNRAKRLLRDWIAFNEKWMRPDRDYIFIVRRDILKATRTDGRVAMTKALRYLSKLDV